MLAGVKNVTAGIEAAAKKSGEMEKKMQKQRRQSREMEQNIWGMHYTEVSKLREKFDEVRAAIAPATRHAHTAATLRLGGGEFFPNYPGVSVVSLSRLYRVPVAASSTHVRLLRRVPPPLV